MPNDDAAEYHLVRREASFAMAAAASDPGIRKIHLELARRHAELANGSLAEKEPRQRVKSSERNDSAFASTFSRLISQSAEDAPLGQECFSAHTTRQ